MELFWFGALFDLVPVLQLRRIENDQIVFQGDFVKMNLLNLQGFAVTLTVGILFSASGLAVNSPPHPFSAAIASLKAASLEIAQLTNDDNSQVSAQAKALRARVSPLLKDTILAPLKSADAKLTKLGYVYKLTNHSSPQGNFCASCGPLEVGVIDTNKFGTFPGQVDPALYAGFFDAFSEEQKVLPQVLDEIYEHKDLHSFLNQEFAQNLVMNAEEDNALLAIAQNRSQNLDANQKLFAGYLACTSWWNHFQAATGIGLIKNGNGQLVFDSQSLTKFYGSADQTTMTAAQRAKFIANLSILKNFVGADWDGSAGNAYGDQANDSCLLGEVSDFVRSLK